eukprot:scaffold3843_cov117-Isochrysis_galbana.AAC.7
MAPGASLEPAVAALRGRFQTKALMSARTAKIKHLILESLSRPPALPSPTRRRRRRKKEEEDVDDTQEEEEKK